MAFRPYGLDDHAIRQVRAGRQTLILHPVGPGMLDHLPTPQVQVASAAHGVHILPGRSGFTPLFGQEGDVLAVREAWALDHATWPPPEVADGGAFLYRADVLPERIGRCRWERADLLPARGYRLFLRVASVGLSRLHRLALDRALVHATGMPAQWKDWEGWPPPDMTEEDFDRCSPEDVLQWVWRKRFRDGDLWAWSLNPLVWVVRIEVLPEPPEDFPHQSNEPLQHA